MSKLVTGIFHTRESAEMAAEELVKSGFSSDDVSILMSDTTQGREFAIKKSTKAPEGAATGAAVGGTLGAIAAGLAAVATLTIPGLQVLAAGPVVAALTGLGAGAAAGGLTGALIGLGIPEHEAKFFHEEIERGGILLGVYTHADRAKIAKEILESAGAEKVRG
jgi:heat induced stress protein YflT